MLSLNEIITERRSNKVMAISSVGLRLGIDRVELLRHPGEDLALDPDVRGKRKGGLSLQVLQDYVWLALHQLVAQDGLSFGKVNAVQLVVLKRRLEAAETLEDGQQLLGRVPNLDLCVLASSD